MTYFPSLLVHDILTFVTRTTYVYEICVIMMSLCAEANVEGKGKDIWNTDGGPPLREEERKQGRSSRMRETKIDSTDAGYGHNMGLLGCTYSEFDNHVGPQLRYQYPENLLSAEAFEQLSDYVIVGKHLTNKVIVVQTNDFQYANYSVIIENVKYERNTLLFAFGILLQKGCEIEPYEVVLRKVSLALTNMEIETEYLFQNETKSNVLNMLQSIYLQIISTGEVFHELDEANFICFKLYIQPRKLIPLKATNVPVLIVNKSSLDHMPWDLSLHHVIRRIDGIRSVKSIAIHAGMEIECVLKCIRMLLFYNCLFVTDVFKFANIYQCLRVLHPIRDKEVVEEMVSFCSTTVTPKQKTSVVTLLMSVRPKLSLKEIITGVCFELDLEGINIQRLMAIAQHKGIIIKI